MPGSSDRVLSHVWAQEIRFCPKPTSYSTHLTSCLRAKWPPLCPGPATETRQENVEAPGPPGHPHALRQVGCAPGSLIHPKQATLHFKIGPPQGAQGRLGKGQGSQTQDIACGCYGWPGVSGCTSGNFSPTHAQTFTPFVPELN